MLIRTIFACSLSFGILGHSVEARESRFEKDGFVIDLVSNGGNCNGCEWIAVEGNIPDEAGEYFTAWVNKMGYTDVRMTVSLDSGGGSLLGGIRLGRAIRKAGFWTTVHRSVPTSFDRRLFEEAPGKCFSACAYAFLGGTTRFINEGEFGLHQFYTSSFFDRPSEQVFSALDFSVQQVVTGLLLEYVLEMGADPRVVVEANSALPSEMNLVTDDKLTEYRVRYSPSTYSPWQAEPYRDGLVIYSRTADERSQLTIFCRTPQNSELIVTYRNVTPASLDNLARTFNSIERFDLYGVAIDRSSIRWTVTGDIITLRVSIPAAALNALERSDLDYGAFSVHADEPRVNLGAFHEVLNTKGLRDYIRLMRKNCTG